MPTTQSAYDWLRSRIAPAPRRPDGAPREHSAREEIDRLFVEIEGLVSEPASPANEATDTRAARDALDDALDAVGRLQVVTANLDACNPPKGEHLSRALVALADERLRGHADAIERGMTYTADNTLRLLRGEGGRAAAK
jgi:hypothetical protein